MDFDEPADRYFNNGLDILSKELDIFIANQKEESWDDVRQMMHSPFAKRPPSKSRLTRQERKLAHRQRRKERKEARRQGHAVWPPLIMHTNSPFTPEVEFDVEKYLQHEEYPIPWNENPEIITSLKKYSQQYSEAGGIGEQIIELSGTTCGTLKELTTGPGFILGAADGSRWRAGINVEAEIEWNVIE